MEILSEVDEAFATLTLIVNRTLLPTSATIALDRHSLFKHRGMSSIFRLTFEIPN